MRILILISTSAKVSTRGLTTELATRLRGHGHSVSVLALGRASVCTVLLAARHADVVVPVDAPLAGAWLARWVLWRPYTAILSQIRPSPLRRIPILSLLAGAMHWNARRVLALNSSTRNSLLQRGVPRKRLELVPPPIATAEPAAPLRPECPRLVAELLENAPMASSALFRILDNVLEDFPGVQLCLGGVPSATAAAEERVRDLGLDAHVVFHEDRAALLHGGGLALVVGAVNEGEGVDFALHAAGAGMVPIAMRNAALEDWLKEGDTAVYVPSGDERAVVAAIGQLLAQPARAQRLGEAARARIQARHHWDAFIAVLLDAIGQRGEDR